MILQGAFEIARRDGVDGLSMPGLAAHLKVGVTSLYWYFRSKEDLLRQMYVSAVQEFERRFTGPQNVRPDDWRQYLIDVNERTRALYVEDTVLAELVQHPLAGHSGQRTFSAYARIEADINLLLRAGFSLHTAWDVYGTAAVYTLGIAVAQRARARSGYPPQGVDQLQMLDVPNMPVLTELVTGEQVVIDFTDTFRSGLDLILDSAERRLADDRRASR